MASEQEKKSEIIDFRGLLAEYRSKWYLFILCVIACVGCAWLYTHVKEPEYTVKANILITQDDEKSGAGQGVRAMFGNLSNMFGSTGHVDDEVFLVSSHSVLRDAVKDLNIHKEHFVKIDPLTSRFKYRDYPVDVFTAPGVADTLMTSLTFKVKVSDEGAIKVKLYAAGEQKGVYEGGHFPLQMRTPYGDFYLNTTKYYQPGKDLNTIITFKGYHVAAEDLNESLQIFLGDKKANIITLIMESSNTDFAKDIINAVIHRYNARSIKDRQMKSERTARFIDERINMLSDSLKQHETLLENFKEANGISSMEADVAYSFSKKGEAELKLIDAQAQSEIFKMLLEFAKNPENKYQLLPATAAMPEAVEAINGYNAMILKRIDLARNAKANSIPMSKIDEQLDLMRQSLINTLAKGYESARLSSAEIRSNIDAADTRLGKIPYQERIQRNIWRQQQIKSEIYIFLLQRREETAMTLANTEPRSQIVDEAYSLSEPKGLKKKAMLMLAVIAGMFLAPILIYMLRITRNKFRSKDELESLTKIPVLGEVCTSRSGQRLVVKPGGSSSVAELFRLIRTNLQFILSDQSDKVVLMTSTKSGEGKSFISINLASSLAMLGKRVVLVGMDIRAPKLSEYLDIHSRYGLTEYLSNSEITLNDIIIHQPLQEGMDIIVAGPVPPNPSELLLTDRVDKLFEKLREMYDYIIVDSAPVGMVSDTFALARISDATIYVCRANFTTLRDVKYFNSIYSEDRLNKMALVVNGTNSRSGYGYGYGDTHVERKWYQKIFKRKKK